MRVFLSILLLAAGAALAEEPEGGTNKVVVIESLSQTNDTKVAAAVKAMSVEKDEVNSRENKAAEAKEVAEIVRNKEEELKKEKSAPKADPWDSFVPPPDSKFDWIQLTSGEWLKGEFKVMYDFKVEFDSDKMGLQEFDFDDVKQLRTHAMKSVFLEGEGGSRDTSILRGLLVVDGDEVRLIRKDHEVAIPRDRVVSIAGGREHERDNWSGSLSIGLNARGGNTKTTDLTIQASLKRRTARTRFNTDYLANYSKSKEVKTASNQRLSGYLDWFFTSRLYWKTLDAEYYRDPFSNIRNQYSFATGAGYDLIRTIRTEWTVNAGVGYQMLHFDSVQAGDADSTQSPFLTTGTTFDYELTGDIDLLYDYAMRLLNKDNGQYTHHMVGKISFELIGDLDLDISVVWDHIQKPQLDSNGNLPQQDDYQFIVGIAYDF